MALVIDNLIIPQGTTYSRVYPVSSPGSDLTGATVKAQIRSGPGTPILYELTTGLVVNTDTSTGSVTISVPAVDSWGFAWHQAYYDVVLTTTDNIVSRLVQGYIVLDLGVTHE